MTKEELCKQYADRKTLDCHNSRFGLSNHDLHVKKSYDLFTGYDIEQAFEDGFDAAIERACIFIKETTDAAGMGNMKQRLKTFRKSMEDNV